MDWNDLHQARGPDEVRRQLHTALEAANDGEAAGEPSPPKCPQGEGPEPEAQEKSRRGFGFDRIGDLLKSARAPEWLIKGILERGAFGAVIGPPGSGKSLAVIDIAVCVATGMPCFGREVAKGLVIYICGEGHAGVVRRCSAKSIHSGVSLAFAPLFISRTSTQLDRADAAAMARAHISEIVEQTGQDPVLIIVDTLARNFEGDENSAADMGAFVRNLDAIGQEWGATVLVVHHTGKDARQGARGSTALRGALDAEYSIFKDVGGNVVLRSEKMKDAAPPQPMSFEMESVELPLRDEDGNPVFGVVLAELGGYQPKAADAIRLGKNEQVALDALAQLFQEHRERLEQGGGDPSTARVEVAEWRERTGLDRRRWPEAKERLEEKGLVRLCHPYAELMG
ncbi:AAA family ATPase [Halomonas ramblicola]|uniref:AAA family ATPase n=1 Tax=Halomonas ramblicola TaxID=747349 RepID=UPI0025B47BB9|nr:helicase RepA family protein [Halomonas ramblicola]MDN3520018.1 helicase RepA family protein [Halomonas ramblicola]